MLALGGMFLAGAVGVYYAAWAVRQTAQQHGYRRDDDGSMHAILYSVGAFLAGAGILLIACAVWPPQPK